MQAKLRQISALAHEKRHMRSAETMKTQVSQVTDDDMRPEYDFTGGVRGKYARGLRKNGYTVRVYNADGTFTETRIVREAHLYSPRLVHPAQAADFKLPVIEVEGEDAGLQQ
jgi:hypothetical protein